MNKMQMKQKTVEIVRDAARQNEISQTAGIMNYLPEVIGAVEIDLDYIRRKVEAELNKKTGNPLNTLLGLMGLRIVNTRRAAEELGLEEDGSFTIDFHEKGNNSESMLKINERKLAAASKKIAVALSVVEADIRDERKKNKEQSGVIFEELDRKTQECGQLSTDLAGQRTAVMERTQYMLSLLGRDSDSPIIGQLVEMLDDIGVDVYWEADGAQFSDNAMFTELKCENPETRHMKPCLANKDSILIKGIRFIPKTSE